MRKMALTLAFASAGLGAALTTVPTQAAEIKLTGAQINDLLPRIVALGDDTQQSFSKSGRTEYISGGQPSVGKWWVTATQYCSSWPPASGHACYNVFRDDQDDSRLIWIGASGTRILNTMEPKE